MSEERKKRVKLSKQLWSRNDTGKRVFKLHTR